MSRTILLVSLLLSSPASAQMAATVGVDEKLGEFVPLKEIVLLDEEGNEVVLADLADRPVALSLIFMRCSGICTPLLNEIARVTDLCTLEPGIDFKLISVSFDTKDTPDLARTKRENQLARMKSRKVAPEAWRFLTGTQENIDRLTKAVGFNYIASEDGQSFTHPGVVTFFTADGKICRYLHGTQFNPMDLRLAVEDTSAGRPRTLIRKITALCFAYDPVGRAYVLKVNRIILAGTLLFALAFVGYLALKRKRGGRPAAARGEDPRAAESSGGSQP